MEKLGIDFDGVLNNYAEVLEELIQKELKKKVDITDYDFFKEFDMTQTEIEDFIAEHDDWINDTLEIDWKTKEYLYKLQNKYELNIITARKYRCAATTVEWLDKQKVPYDNIYFCCGDKVDVCEWLDVEFMVEDSPWNLKKLGKNNIPCFIMDAPYNQSIKETDAMIRVFSWKDIYDILM